MRCTRPLLIVGDVVTVGCSWLDNPAGSLALVVDVFPWPSPGSAARAVTLLFPQGQNRACTPDDLLDSSIERLGHLPAFAGYVYTSAAALADDYRAGYFAAVWRGWV